MELEVYSRRWGHNEPIIVEKIANGWYIEHGPYRGNCNSRGEPELINILEHDGINYPADLGGYMEKLWDESEEPGLNENEIQNNLNILGQWIRLIEKSSPEGVWHGY